MSNKLCWVFRNEDSMTGEEMKRYIEQGRLYRDKRDAYYYYFHGVVSEVQKPTKPLNGLKGDWIPYGHPIEDLEKVEQ